MATISKEALQAAQRRDFALFVERSFSELNSHTEYLHNWHIDVIADRLEQCRTGKLRRLIINVPPRSLKSHMASVAFPAYLLGLTPSSQIICASYAQDLADKHAGDCRSLMSSPWYQELFRATRLASKRSAVSDFNTTARGFRLSTSVGGVLTGRGADFIIIDDPLKPDEALSQSQRKTVNDWFSHSLISRLNNKKTGCIILIMQRLHEDDLVGHVLRQGGWELISFPAVAEKDEEYTVRDQWGMRTFRRQIGQALHPEREPLELLAEIREIQGEYNFAGQYQQSPAPLGGGMIKVGWFRTYKENDLPKDFELIFQSWDSASKSSELNDYSVCTTWGLREKKLYLLNVLRKRMDYPELRRMAKQHAADFAAKNIVIEDKASGTQLIQDLVADGLYGAARYQPQGDKILRMHTASTVIENGFVYLPEKAEWLAEYLHELSIFPNGRFDDQVDSTSQALDWIKIGAEPYGLIEYLKKKSGEVGATVTKRLSEWRKSVHSGPLQTTAQQQDQISQMSQQQKPAAAPGSILCSDCGEVMTQAIPSGLRCQQCGDQWDDPKLRPKVPRFSRKDVLNGQWDSGWRDAARRRK